MELVQMQYFERIAAYENISKAAADLNITQPALSNALHRLESELGYPLFDRNGKKLVLNEEGKQFLVTVKQMLHLLNQYHFRKQAKDLHGVITICCSIVTPAYFHFVNEYQEKNPRVSFQLATGSNNHQMISENNYDLAILPEDELHRSQKNRIVITKVHLYAIMSRQNPLSARGKLSFSDLKDETFCFSWRSNNVEKNLARLNQAGISPSISHLVDQTLAKIQVVENSNSVAFLYDLELPYLKNYPDVVMIPISEDDAPPFNLYLTWRDNIADSPSAADFLEHLKEKLERTYLK